MSAVSQGHPDHVADFKIDQRVLLLSVIATGLGVLGGLAAKALLWLIGVITNLAYFHRLSSQMASPADSHPGLASVIVPVVGGLIVGAMARYGSEKIRGHGIPSAPTHSNPTIASGQRGMIGPRCDMVRRIQPSVCSAAARIRSNSRS